MSIVPKGRLSGASEEQILRARKALTDVLQTRLESPEWDDAPRDHREREDAAIRELEGIDSERRGSE